jgi:hypothetical protein
MLRPDGPRQRFAASRGVADELRALRETVAEPVDPGDVDLEQIPQALGGFRTERGANLTLIADPEHLASSDARTDADGRVIAPPSRVMLDLYLEPGGEAAVGVFLDLWGSKDIT